MGRRTDTYAFFCIISFTIINLLAANFGVLCWLEYMLMDLFSHFDQDQKELFIQLLDEVPCDTYDCTDKDIEHIEMIVVNNESFDKKHKEIIRSSTILLRILKEVLKWKHSSYNSPEEAHQQLIDKKTELLKYLQYTINKTIEKK
jgi:hypothetical protein